MLQPMQEPLAAPFPPENFLNSALVKPLTANGKPSARMGDQHSQNPGAGNSVNSIGDEEGPAIQIDSQTLIKSSIATQTHLTKRSSQQTEGLPKKSERKANEESGKGDVA